MVKKLIKYKDPTHEDWIKNLMWATDAVNSTKLMYDYSPREIAFGIKTEIDRSEFTNLLIPLIEPTDDKILFQEVEQLQIRLHELQAIDDIRQKHWKPNKRLETV